MIEQIGKNNDAYIWIYKEYVIGENYDFFKKQLGNGLLF